jgi:Uma2 family endonuclease
MASPVRFRSADLEWMPDDGKRYEIIGGELHVSRPPHWLHQACCFRIAVALDRWRREAGAGLAVIAPGLVLGDEDDVVPDVVWVSTARLKESLDEAGHLRAAPDLAVEVLSSGSANERRDRTLKLDLYSRRGVREYWIVDWRLRQVEVYRRREMALEQVGTLREQDTLETPLLPGFRCPVAELFDTLP